MRSLTTHLLTLPADPSLATSTSSPHLATHVRTTLLSSHILAQCLTQDRLFAHAYIRFVGKLLSTLDPTLPSLSSPQASILEDTSDALISALGAMKHKLAAIEKTVQAYRFLIGDEVEVKREANAVTRDYKQLFESVLLNEGYSSDGGDDAARGGAGMLNGLVLVWAIQTCHLEAKTNSIRAKEYEPTDPPRALPSVPSPTPSEQCTSCTKNGRKRKRQSDPLAVNWEEGEDDDDEGGMLVQKLREVVDGMARWRASSGNWSHEESECEEVWRRVLVFEGRFWGEMLRQD